MPEDVGGTPFPDGWEPDDDHDHGVSDEEFASVVFDEAFVRAAVVHEPTAVERLLAAAQARAAEAEARRAARAGGERYDDGYGRYRADAAFDDEDEDLDVLEDGYGHSGPYGRPVRWHRPVAWVLALVMGIGMVALAFTAVYRGASSDREEQVPPPASTEPVPGGAVEPSASVDSSQPAIQVIPHSP